MNRQDELQLIRIRSLIPEKGSEALVIVSSMREEHLRQIEAIPSSLSHLSRREQAERELSWVESLAADLTRSDFDAVFAGIAHLLAGNGYDGSSPDYFSMDDYFSYDED